MAGQAQIGSTYNLTKYTFTATNVADASGTLIAGQTGAVDYTVPYAGSVVGVTFRGSGTVGGTLTTGTLVPLVMINGVAAPPFPTANVGIMVSQRSGYFTQDAEKADYGFAPGASIGLVYSKTGTIEPTTLDLTAEVWVLHENVRY
jgi:hypothetical protein